MATVVANIQSGDPDTDALLAPARWNPAILLRFGFPPAGANWTGYFGNSEPTQNYAPLNAAQQTVVTAIFRAVEQFANISFVNSTEVNEAPETATFRFGMTDEEEVAHAYIPNSQPIGGDVWLNRSSGEFNNPVRGDYAYSAIMHEIGHALGLLHPHDGDNFGTMSLAHDNMNYTVMTYRSYQGMPLEEPFPNGDFGFPQSYMMYDIAALQHMYGANYGTNSGDTVYSWSPTSGTTMINGATAIAPGGNVVFLTIWDGGGIDTYDFSAYGDALVINLLPGEWSFSTSLAQRADLGDGHRAIGNVANAFLYHGDVRSLIENAIGGSGEDQFFGNQAANTFTGGGGNDWLDGGLGADRMIGGTGNDRYFVDNQGDVIVEAVGEGQDSVEVTASVYVLGANVEQMTGMTTLSAQDLTGNDSANSISLSNNLNGNRLDGAGGNDTLRGGAGADHLIGGAGADSLGSFEGDDVLEGGEGNDTLFSGPGDDQLFGGDGDDVLVAAGGADLLDGGEGNDQIEGNSGADIMLGGAGNDKMFGEEEDDRLEGGSGADELHAGSGADQLYGGDGNDLLEGGGHGDTIFGDLGDDHIYGDSVPTLDFITHLPNEPAAIDFEGIDVITGGGGADLIEAGAGMDRIVYLAASDSFAGSLDRIRQFESGGDKVDLTALVVSALSWTELNDPGDGTLYSLVSVTTPGLEMKIRIDGHVAMADFLVTIVPGATEGNDVIFGTAGDDQIDALGGNDLLDLQQGGNDQIAGGSGDDDFSFGAAFTASDLVNGGSGLDRLLLAGDYSAGVAFGPSTLSGVERIVLGAGFDYRLTSADANVAAGLLLRIDGSQLSGANSLNFNGGAELDGGFDLIGGAGNDQLTGGAGNDIVNSGAGNDTISTGDGFDYLDGGADADIMSGGLGDDIYVVDNSGDQVVEAASAGFDLVRSSVSFTLGSEVENLVLTGTAAINGTGNGLGNYLGGNSGANLLDGNLGADTMEGGLGDDVYIVDNVGDLVIELAGGGTDEIRTGLAAYSIAGLVEVETLTGTSPGGQSLTGNARSNLITGVGGNDILDGGLGADTLRGGVGNDVYFVDDAGDIVVELGGEGSDEIRTALASYTLGSNLENLTGLSGTGQTLIGNDLANVIIGGLGSDILAGAGGADQLSGGAGDDIYYLDGADSVTELADQGSDEIRTDLASYSLAGLANVENLTGLGSGDQNLTGNGLNNVINGGAGADTMTGGLGDDFYYVDSGSDVVVELAGEGTDTIGTSLAFYDIRALPQVENLIAVTDNAHSFVGNSGNNLLSGAAGNDTLNLRDGGNDSVNGGAGNDVIHFGATLTAADSVDGGTGIDQVVLQGNYAALSIGSSFVSIESLAILPGSDLRFGDPGGNFYSYNLGMNDANVAAGATMVVDANRLRAGENLQFDGSAEHDGAFFIYGGGGTDALLGGLGNDTFYFGENGQFGATDRVHGGAGGTDQLGLRGNYTIVFGATQLTSIESLGLVSAQDTRFGALGTSYNYNLTMNDGNLTAGVRMTVDAAPLRGSETLTFDGSAELDGSFRIFGGQGADTIKGSQGNDLITGGTGADSLRGGGGADQFIYRSVADSTSAAHDTIQDFASGDLINLSQIDAISGGANDAFTFIGSNAFSNTAGELRAVFENNAWTVQGDVNGDGIADMEMIVVSDHPIVGGDFIL